MHNCAIYVSTEDGREATGFLLKKQSYGYGLPSLENLLFAFNYDRLYDDISLWLQRQPADLVVIDCFQDVYGNDLKDSQQIRIFLNRYQELAERQQCLFLFLHHTGKRTENHEPSKNNLLSGQALEAKMRLVIELRADQMNPLLRHLCIVKGNYLAAGTKRQSYVLEFEESTFTFTNTGERVPFEKLVKRESDGEEEREKFLEVLELRQTGLSYDKIAARLGTNKAKVYRLLRKAKESGWAENIALEDDLNSDKV